MTIDELIERAHAQAVKSGWWPAGNWPSVATCVNNFNGEIAEAWEEYRHGRMEVWWSFDGKPVDIAQNENRRLVSCDGLVKAGTRWTTDLGWVDFVPLKPEGFWIEIVDLCIRLADTAGAYGWPVSVAESRTGENRLPVIVKRLRRGVYLLECDDIDGWSSWAKHGWSAIVQDCIRYAKNCGVDLMALCELKMEYNATRPIRHGGLRA